MQEMQQGTTTRYSLDDICPYPFDQSLNMVAIPLNFEIPKYDKYNGKSDPRDHIREFCTMSLEFSHDDTYMMRLFLWSLGGQMMEWLSKIMPPIRSFEELVNKFVSQYSYNIQHEVTMLDLCNTKQKNNEPFMMFLRRWRRLISIYPWTVTEKGENENLYRQY